MQRMTAKPQVILDQATVKLPDQATVKGLPDETTVKLPDQTTTIRLPDQTTVKIPETTLESMAVSTDLLNDMMRLIEEGQLSQMDVIEELINNGVLPVEVTQIGKIPIIVGAAPIGGSGINTNVGQSQPLMRKVPKFSSKPKPREEVNLERLQQLRIVKPQMIMRDDHHIMQEVGLDDPDGDFEMVQLVKPRKTLPLSIKPESLPPVPFLEPISQELPIEVPETKEEKDIEILSSMMDLFDQGLISDAELEQMVIMMESEGVLDVDLEELGIENEEPEGKDVEEDNKYRAYGLSSDDFGEGPSVGQPDPYFTNKHTIRPFIVDNHPVLPKAAKGAVSYAHFTMHSPNPTPIPPEIPPLSNGNLHKNPYFEDPFDHSYQKFKGTKLDFKPKLPQLANPEFGVRPGPAPPYYLSARLPAPPNFNHKPAPHSHSTHEKNPFGLKEGLEFDIYGQSITSSPREPFPPPIELKRHIPKQPLPLILHDPGTGYKTPHFDIPASILDPKAYMKSLKKAHLHHDAHGHLHQHLPSSQFLPRKGRLNFDDFQTSLRSKRKIETAQPVPVPPIDVNTTPLYNPPVSGYSQVDRKFAEIRQSYIKGDSLGTGASHFGT